LDFSFFRYQLDFNAFVVIMGINFKMTFIFARSARSARPVVVLYLFILFLAKQV